MSTFFLSMLGSFVCILDGIGEKDLLDSFGFGEAMLIVSRFCVCRMVSLDLLIRLGDLCVM